MRENLLTRKIFWFGVAAGGLKSLHIYLCSSSSSLRSIHSSRLSRTPHAAYYLIGGFQPAKRLVPKLSLIGAHRRQLLSTLPPTYEVICRTPGVVFSTHLLPPTRPVGPQWLTDPGSIGHARWVSAVSASFAVHRSFNPPSVSPYLPSPILPQLLLMAVAACSCRRELSPG